MKQYYYTKDKVSFIGIEKKEFVERMYDWANDDEITHYMFTGTYPSNKEKLEKEYESYIEGPNVVFFVLYNDLIIGVVGLYGINWQARNAELRILLGGKNIRRKGIGTTACEFIVDYAFNKLNLEKVWLGVNVENKGAIRCYEKSGFYHEGVLRNEIFRNGRYYNATRMSVLRNENEKNGGD